MYCAQTNVHYSPHSENTLGGTAVRALIELTIKRAQVQFPAMT